MSLAVVYASGARNVRDKRDHDPELILRTILSRLKHLDLTGKIHSMSSTMNSPGGYADVFTGFAKLGLYEIKVAIKRLRVHILDDFRLAKVVVPAHLPRYQLIENALFMQYLAKEMRAWSKLHHTNVLPFLI